MRGSGAETDHSMETSISAQDSSVKAPFRTGSAHEDVSRLWR